MQKLAANLTEKMLRRKLISPEQAEWCAYLVECKLEQMLCFSVLIALGCLIAPLWKVRCTMSLPRRSIAPTHGPVSAHRISRLRIMLRASSMGRCIGKLPVVNILPERF